MELEFLTHMLWWLCEGLSRGDPYAYAVVIAMPVVLAVAFAWGRWEQKGQQSLRLKRNPPP